MPDLPVVDRSEVHEVFRSWKSNSATTDSDSTEIKKPKKTPSVTTMKPGRSPSPPSNRLPKLYPLKQVESVTFHRARANDSSPERRRFVTVVRPLSVFPEPPPPPNFSSSKILISSYPSQALGRSGGGGGGGNRPPSPAPFARNRPNIAVSGHGFRGSRESGSGSLESAGARVNLAGGSGWDLTALRRNYGNSTDALVGLKKFPNLQEGASRYQSHGNLKEESISGLPPWNPYFAYAKSLTHAEKQAVSEDWRQHFEARRRALQRRRARRRGIADGGASVGHPEPRAANDAQTDGKFDEFLRRANESNSGVQTEHIYRSRYSNANGHDTVESSTQVVLEDFPDYEESLSPAIQVISSQVLEQAFIEVLEEEEIEEIRQRRKDFQERKMAELTTSKLMNVQD